MGIFSDLFDKHGHKKDKVIQELLDTIKLMEQEAILSERNETRLIKENERLYNDLQKCLHQHTPAHPVKLAFNFS